MAEPIEMPFSLWAPMGPRNHVLDGVQIHSAVTCAKTAEPINLWLDCGVVGPNEAQVQLYSPGGANGHIDATW